MFSCDLGLTGAADAIDIQREAVLAKTLQMIVTDGVGDFGRLKLRDLATYGTYLMAMAIVVVAGLVFRRALEAVSDDQTQFHEQPQRVIKSGTTYRKPFLFIEFVT